MSSIEGWAPAEGWADDLVDELLPEDLEWQRLTRRYPGPALLCAAVGGFALGWSRGPTLLGAVSSMVAAQIARNVESALSGAVSSDVD